MNDDNNRRFHLQYEVYPIKKKKTFKICIDTAKASFQTAKF